MMQFLVLTVLLSLKWRRSRAKGKETIRQTQDLSISNLLKLRYSDEVAAARSQPISSSEFQSCVWN